MSSSKNERTFRGEGVGGLGVLKNEQGRTRGEVAGSKLGNLEQTYFLNIPKGFRIRIYFPLNLQSSCK